MWETSDESDDEAQTLTPAEEEKEEGSAKIDCFTLSDDSENDF
jgi:hypothetical protein